MSVSAKLKLKKVRASYVNLVTPRAIVEGGDKYYSVALLIKKDDPQIKEYKRLVEEIYGELKWTPVQIKKADNGLRDGNDRIDQPEYDNMYYINTKNRTPVTVLDRMKEEISADKIYSGCYVNASLTLYGYDQAGNKGIGIGLNGIQFYKNGEPLAASFNKDDFDSYEDEDDDEDWMK